MYKFDLSVAESDDTLRKQGSVSASHLHSNCLCKSETVYIVGVPEL